MNNYKYVIYIQIEEKSVRGSNYKNGKDLKGSIVGKRLKGKTFQTGETFSKRLCALMGTIVKNNEYYFSNN